MVAPWNSGYVCCLRYWDTFLALSTLFMSLLDDPSFLFSLNVHSFFSCVSIYFLFFSNCSYRSINIQSHPIVGISFYSMSKDSRLISYPPFLNNNNNKELHVGP